MNDELDELAETISQALGGWSAKTRSITDVANALWRAGYRKVKGPSA